MKILIVDDDPDVGRMLGVLLKRKHHAVTTTTSGRVALTLARDEAFDIVLLDVRMPEMDGFAVLHALRVQGCAAGIIMLTGQGDVEDAVKAAHLGANDYLPKPVRLAGLERVLESVTAPRPQSTEPEGDRS